MATYEFHHVDVFTDTPYEGNPLAVVLAPDELPTATMQRIANEFNLSETVFIGPSTREDTALRLRIFTPQHEMAFAGHPTIGAAFVAHREGMLDAPTFAFEENVGPVAVTIAEGDAFEAWLTTPLVRLGTRVAPAAVAHAVGLAADDCDATVMPQTASAGSAFLYARLRDTAAVDRASGDDGHAIRALCREAGATGLYVFALGEDGDVYARMFAPELGIVEDPATGSAAGPLAGYLLEHRLLDPHAEHRFVVHQGVAMGRRSIIHVRVTGVERERTIAIGGGAVHVMEGTLTA